MEDFTTPLVSVKWLSENLDNPKLVILNATIPKVTDIITRYEEKQITNARFFHIKKVFSDTSSHLPNTFPSTEQFHNEAQKLGINNDSFIVVYDDHGIYSSPRAWWLFKSFGHSNVAVLDGGLPAWQSENLALENPKPYTGPSGNFKAQYQNGSIKSFNEVLATLTTGHIKILDARSQERFRGSIPEPREGLRSGHIPNSKNLPYSELLNDGKMVSKDALIEKFKDYQNKELIFSCGSGITACILALGAEAAGLKSLSVYDGSWTEWGSRHELPIEVE